MKVLPVPTRSNGNYRLYPPEAVHRVRLIRRALAVGFSLPELGRILKIRDEDGAPCSQVKRLLEEKLVRLDQQILNLQSMREHLQAVLADWETRLSRTPDGKPARLLESLGIPACDAQVHGLKGRAT
jgi:DNA-binding transcriptional MerR regulator